MTQLFLGVDAGNSKTLAVVGDERGRILGWARSGLGDIYGADSPAAAIDEVFSAIARAIAQAAGDALARTTLRSAAFRLAGVDWNEDEHLWSRTIAERLPDLPTSSVKNDGFALLRCGDRRGVGVALNVGTGAAMAGRGPSGDEFVVSWWFQHYLGGAGLGHDALKAVMLAELGLGEPTALANALCTFYGRDSVEELLHAFTQRIGPLGHRDKSRAARIVCDVALGSDPVALAIVREHAFQLSRYVATTARRVGFDAENEVVPLTLGGSVLSGLDSILRRHLIESLAAVMPHAIVHCSQTASPVHGALLDALAEGGIDLTEAIQQLVLAQPLPHDLVRT